MTFRPVSYTHLSQLQNREYAMEMMKAKLYQIALQQHKDKIDDIKGCLLYTS